MPNRPLAPLHSNALLLLVVSSFLDSACGEGNCFWVGGLDWCAGTDDSPLGERWAYLAAANIYCVTRTLRPDGVKQLGCSPGTNMTVCKDVQFDYLPEGQSECLPAFSNYPRSYVPQLECITVTDASICEQNLCFRTLLRIGREMLCPQPYNTQNRRDVATALGCPECTETFIKGQEVQIICRSGGSEEQCREINPGSNFASGEFPAEQFISEQVSMSSRSQSGPWMIFIFFHWMVHGNHDFHSAM